MLHGAIIGCGYISKQQLTAWRRVQGARIVAVCDLEESRARQRAREFEIMALYTDYRQMLDAERLDFIDIATRPSSHLQLVTAVAERGLHVLCQKPIAGSMDEARQIVAACDRAGVVLMVNENGRHQAWFRRMKSLLVAGALGDLHNACFFGRWRATLPTPDFEGQPYFQEMPQLLVFEMGVHYLDTARYLFGEAQSVFARLHRVSPHIAGEDKALLLLEFGSMTCLVDSNWYAVPVPQGQSIAWGPLLVEGTVGTLLLREDGTLLLYSEEHEQQWRFPTDTIDRSFVATQQHFVDCLQKGMAPETGGRDTLRTMALVFGAYRSDEEGRVVYSSEFDLDS